MSLIRRLTGGTWPLLLVALIWAMECWFIQSQTLILDVGGDEAQVAMDTLKRGMRRFSIDILIALMVVFMVPSRWLTLLFIGHLFVSILIFSFFNYFGEPLTWTIAVNQSGEGLEVGRSVLTLLNGMQIVILLAGLAVKFILLETAIGKGVDAGRARRFAGGALAVYILMMIPLTTISRPLNHIGTWRSFTQTGTVYGYAHSWLAESLFIDGDILLERANQAAKQTGGRFGAIPVIARQPDRITVIQIESLDFEAIDVIVEDGPLMPFLSGVKESAVIAEIESVHLSSSSDADFTFLMASMPNGWIPPYKVPGFDFSNSIISDARLAGYESYAYHGNRGTYFSRRSGFRDMGFDSLNFQEDMESLYTGKSRWGIPDDAVFEIAATQGQQSINPSVTVIITLTTHFPFDLLYEEDRELFPEPLTTAQRYFNNMRYIDRLLDSYFQAMPDGTLFFIYGDHPSEVAYSVTLGNPPQTSDTVPFIVLQKGASHQTLQPLFDAAKEPRPSLLDASEYFQRHIRG